MEGGQSAQNSTTKYETEMINMLMKMNEDMLKFTEAGGMGEGAYNELSKLQKTQCEQIKTMFGHIKNLVGSEYFQKKCGSADAPLRKKRMTEKAKREDAKHNPDKYHICPACDSIFGTKFNLLRHRRNTLKCSVIKCSKKGAIEMKNHRAPIQISEYISNHFEDGDSDEDIAEQQNEDAMEDLLQETQSAGTGLTLVSEEGWGQDILANPVNAEMEQIAEFQQLMAEGAITEFGDH